MSPSGTQAPAGDATAARARDSRRRSRPRAAARRNGDAADLLAVDLADDELADPAVGDERARGRGPRRPPRPGRRPRAASGASRRRARGRAPRRRRRARRTRPPRAGAAAGRSRRGAATAARRRTGWPDRPRPGGGPRPTPPASAGSRTARSRSSAPGQRELRRPEPVDEVAAPDPAGLLHRAQDRVDGREAAVDALGRDRLAGQDAVALEEGQALGVEPLGGPARRASGLGRDERPATGRLGRSERRQPAGPAAGRRAPLPVRFQRSARSGANVSLVTSPAQTRSHSASRTSRSELAARPP